MVYLKIISPSLFSQVFEMLATSKEVLFEDEKCSMVW